MPAATIPLVGMADAWRKAARDFLAVGVPPHEARFRMEGEAEELFAEEPAVAFQGQAPSFPVPRSFVELAGDVCFHSDPERFGLLYALLWRLRSQRNLMADASDPALARLEAMAKAVRRDSHKMKAFVRFREMEEATGGRRRFFAWFEPEHLVVERTAPFFARRFADMDWAIATPSLTAIFTDGDLRLEPTRERPVGPDDATDDLWRTYFASIFNPARLKVKAMQAEMPKKYWKNLPEAELIPDLIAQASTRRQAMIETPPTSPNPLAARVSPPAPASQPAEAGTLAALRREAEGCRRCPIGFHATQTVFGEGSPAARLVFVGEQPGDQEDLAGRPFVGPAGQMFDAALDEAGISRTVCYVTNAVKHFKFEPRGKRRLHKRPDGPEILACKWWLERELALLKPGLVVALGATAAQSLTGDGGAILRRRGRLENRQDGLPVFLTIHPSMILRIPDREAAAAERRRFVDDLRQVRTIARELGLLGAV